MADLRVRHAPLHGVQIPEYLVPLAIDEFPALFIAAACAEGITVLTGAEELRVKESDRIQVMADGLTALGIAAGPTTDGIVIRGGAPSGGTVDSHGDHRIAMSFAMAALRSRDPVSIRDCANVNTSFPDFMALARIAGLNLAERGRMSGEVPVIAIDGPSGVGKGTLCQWLAARLGWHLLDSGALYRLTALAAQRRGLPLEDEAQVAAVAIALDAVFVADVAGTSRVLLDGAEVGDILRGEAAGNAASRVAALPAVRAALLQRQRNFRRPPV